MRCSDCLHFKDRYVLYMDGGFPQLQELLDKGLIESKDFMCEGFGCIFQPCQDFTCGNSKEEFMAIPFQDLENNMEKQCENFEARRKDEAILVKNLSVNPLQDRKYHVYGKLSRTYIGFSEKKE